MRRFQTVEAATPFKRLFGFAISSACACMFRGSSTASSAAANPFSSAARGSSLNPLSNLLGRSDPEDISQKSRKAAAAFSGLAVQLANDTSLGLYRVQEHVHKKVPQLVGDRQDLLQLRSEIDISTADAKEMHDTLRAMDRIDSFAHVCEYMDQIAALQASHQQHQQLSVQQSK